MQRNLKVKLLKSTDCCECRWFSDCRWFDGYIYEETEKPIPECPFSERGYIVVEIGGLEIEE